MGLKKGQVNNPTGRPKGSPNKVTEAMRENINVFLNANWQTIQNDFKALEPKDRLTFYEKLLKYTLPTLQAQSITTDFEKMTDEQLDQIIERLTRSQEV